MSSINGLAITSALNELKNKIPDGSKLFKKAYYNSKILEIENKYITKDGYNKYNMLLLLIT